MIIDVVGVPGNGQFDPEGACRKDRVRFRSWRSARMKVAFMLRDMLAAGQKQDRPDGAFDIEIKKDVPDQDIVATLPGMSDQVDFVLAHTDSYFQGADNAAGMATAIDIARHYAALPISQRAAHHGVLP